jgi:hypothetical protein
VAPFRVERVFVANSGHGPGVLGLWMLLPIALAAAAIAAVRTQRIGAVWMTVGAVWGFVIIAAWSLGTFFAAEGLALLVAGGLHLAAVRPGWRLLLVPLWFVAGAAAICPIFILRDVVWEMQGQGHATVTHADIVVWGCWLFAGTLMFLGVVEAIARAGRAEQILKS